MVEQLMLSGIKGVKVEGMRNEHILVEKFLDVRYLGQSYELTIPFSDHFQDEFRIKHLEVYGYALPAGSDIEIVNIRVRATGEIEIPEVQPEPLGSEDPSKAKFTYKPVYFDKAPEDAPCYLADDLQPGNQLQGPALIIRSDTVILLTGADSARVDAFRNILLTIGG
jgi:N-methylhydantoinase A